MGTKWKNGKTVREIAAFFFGMTLFLCNVCPFLGLGVFLGVNAKGEDYQETERFRSYISSQLEEMASIAVGGDGGNGWAGSRSDAVVTGEADAVVTEEADAEASREEEGIFSWLGRAGEALGGEAEETGTAMQAEETVTDDEEESARSREERLKRHMDSLSGDRNLRYAIIRMEESRNSGKRGILLYTNIDALEGKGRLSWQGEDFSKLLSDDRYNFFLWLNRNGDGKVEIEKDGKKEDVYGDGVYRPGSRWRVPGYKNFTIGDEGRDAVVFLAAAKKPSLYVVGNYLESGVSYTGGTLYEMQRDLELKKEAFRRHGVWLAASVLLLAYAFCLRKGQANRAVARVLGNVWLEAKAAAFLALFPWMFCRGAAGYLTQVFGLAGQAAFSRGALDWEPYRGASDALLFAGSLWLAWLAALDFRYNRGKQKKPFLDSIRAKGLLYPVQKRLVRRYARLAALGFVLAAAPLLWVLGHGMRLSRPGMAYALLACLYVAAAVFGAKQNRRLAEDFALLSDRIRGIRDGVFSKPLELPEDADLRQLAEDLNEIQGGMETALQEQVRSERMKVALVTNVSHDIKTPLTSVISYVELLKQETGLPGHVEEYIRILGEKSERLNTIVQDVFEISKASSGELPLKMEKLDFGKLLRQTLADMGGQIEESGLEIKSAVPERPVYIQADGQKLYRVFQNLIQNALQYSLPGSRAYLTLREEEAGAVATLKNTSSMELDASADFTERFVRGDASRTDGGSGLGLSIAKSFTEACGGSFDIRTDADLFTVTVAFQSLETEAE